VGSRLHTCPAGSAMESAGSLGGGYIIDGKPALRLRSLRSLRSRVPAAQCRQGGGTGALTWEQEKPEATLGELPENAQSPTSRVHAVLGVSDINFSIIESTYNVFSTLYLVLLCEILHIVS